VESPVSTTVPEARAKASSLALGVELWIGLDFECTYDEDVGLDRQVRSDEGEIIEFLFVVYDAVKKQVAPQGQHYCKDVNTPITKFGTALTGIPDDTLEKIRSLQEALDAFNKVMYELEAENRVCCAVAHGSSYLELVLPSSCLIVGAEVPKVLRRYVDLREATQSFLLTRGLSGNGIRPSLCSGLTRLAPTCGAWTLMPSCRLFWQRIARRLVSALMACHIFVSLRDYSRGWRNTQDALWP